jgi:hypothetical protein
MKMRQFIQWLITEVKKPPTPEGNYVSRSALDAIKEQTNFII